MLTGPVSGQLADTHALSTAQVKGRVISGSLPGAIRSERQRAIKQRAPDLAWYRVAEQNVAGAVESTSLK
jgi:hypothetical protein